VINELTLRDEIHETSVSDVDTVLNLESDQLRTSPRDDGQTSVRQPRASAQSQTLRRMFDRVSRQKSHHSFQGQIGVRVFAGQRDFRPQVGFPREEVEPSADSGTPDQVVGVEERQNPQNNRIWKSIKLSDSSSFTFSLQTLGRRCRG
jgi:hypothetical protein